MSRIQRQRECVEQKTGVKDAFGKGRRAKTQNQPKTANSQPTEKPLRYFVSDLKNRLCVNKNQNFTLSLLKQIFCQFWRIYIQFIID